MKYETHAVDAASTLTQLSGYSAESSAAGATKVYIRKTDASGDILVRVALAAGATETVTFTEPLDPGDKLYVDVAADTAITIWGF